MVELSDLQTKLCIINQGYWLVQAFYLYSDLAYSTVYKIIKPYKNYSNCPKTTIYNYFNKIMFRFCIKVYHKFVLHQNF